MKKITLIVTSISFTLFSCSKEKNCSNAELCVANETGSVVHYAWHSNLYVDSVPPGGVMCTFVGEVKVRPWGGTTVTTTLNTDHGDYAWEVTECHQKESIH